MSFIDRVYSVSDITFYIENLFLGDPKLTDVTVAGEVIDCKSRNGHLFFSLRDDYATIGCILFGGAYMGISIMDGQMAQVTGDVRVYALRGQYRLLCKRLKLLPSRGTMFLKLKETYERLSKLGLFSKPKKSLPKFPSKIGVITSRNSAAFQDILRTISERFPFVKVVLYHTAVQGEEAKRELMKALLDANSDELDVVIIARGGGATEDLWLFNDEEVVMVVHSMRHPVITGVGHQIDTVLVDLVADVAAHTPTAAAQYAVPDIREIVEKVRHSLKLSFVNLMTTWNTANERSKELLKEARRNSIDLLQRSEMRLKSKFGELKSLLEDRVDSLERNLELLRIKLDLLNPMSELNRGYVIVEKNGVKVRSRNELNENDILLLRFHDGSVRVIVDEDRRIDERT
ncbi:exodeoxyribonuclease VII large subunit [Pseudothermotoga sp.]|uniref:exodeoxyribonuclease VII large subunit n=1 Tax=Pseudothermotoga sp. TaxID=2033661 RepID=UPI0031F65120